MNTRIFRLVTLLFVITLTMGCSMFSSGPDDETIKSSFYQSQELLTKDWEIIDYKITNRYKKEIDKETVYVYETEFRLKNRTTGQFLSEQNNRFTFGLIKRGNSWYIVQ